MSLFVDCVLTVKEDARRERLVEYRVKSPGYQPVEAAICHDELTRLSVERLNRWIGTHRDVCEREDLRALGLHLYRILFTGVLKNDPTRSIGDVFKQTHSDALKQPHAADVRMRLTLVFEAAVHDLAAYPWEFLFIPLGGRDGFFLTGEKRELILTRAVSPSLVETFEPEKQALNILIVVSKPRELAQPNEEVGEEIDQLKAAIERADAAKTINVDRLGNPTQEELRTKVNNFKPHIVHLIGHGRPGGLALFKNADELAHERELVQEQRKPRIEEADWVDGNSVRAIFNTHPPRIVFLHACNSANPDSLTSFRSIAQQVLDAGVAGVVAMQYEITNDDATRFATTFYQQLGEGKSIDEAVKEGRTALAEMKPAWGHPRFGTPVVFLQSEGLPIFAKKPDESSQRKDVTDGADPPVQCPYACGNMVLATARRCNCDKKQPLKRCVRCERAVRGDDEECPFCLTEFPKQPPPLAPAEGAPSAATSRGQQTFTR